MLYIFCDEDISYMTFPFQNSLQNQQRYVIINEHYH